MKLLRWRYPLLLRGYVITRRIVRLLRTSELQSEINERKRRIFDDTMLKKLGHCVAKPTTSNARGHVPCSDGVDPDSIKLSEDNDLIMSNKTSVFENPYC